MKRLQNFRKKIIAENRMGKRWRMVIALLSCAAFFCTAYLLIVPAITLQEDPLVSYQITDGETATGDLSKPVKTDSATTVRVSAEWSQLPLSGGITVTLYKDGKPTDKTLTLDKETNWEGEFGNLEAGEYAIQYSVIDGYEYFVNSETDENIEFLQTDALVGDNTYLLVGGTTVKYAVQNNGGTALSDAEITVSNATVSEAATALQWYYNGVSLQNVATGNYLKLNTTGASTDPTTQNRIVYENGLVRRADTVSRYLRRNNGSYTVTAYSTYATPFALYEKSGKTTVDFEIYGEKIKNDPAGSDISSFEHNKTIDYLGDGVLNPDTALSGQDDYRLYLDMTGKQEPIDLLIVVDGSGSMSKTDVDRMRRDTAITKFLNGGTNVSNGDGFLSYFFKLNSDNRVSIVQFYGKSADRDSHNLSNGALDYTYDSTVLMDWTTKNRFVNCANQNNSGTNYEAGLKRAANQFSKLSDDGHKKMMIFLSDGVPTYFLIDRNDVGTVCNGYTIKTSDVGKRWGTGSYTSTSNYPYCKNPSKKAFDDFLATMPEVTVFTIGVSADISETSQSESQSPEVLKYMAEQGNGVFLSVISSMDELKLQLQSIFYPKGVTITDELSKYVCYNEENPDVLVTMREKTTGAITVLYQFGQPTAAASGILTDVIYTAGDTGNMPTGSTGMISAIFDADYPFPPEYTFTLSFNVTVTRTAYKEYSSGGYNAVGDAKTDYGTNVTSSEKDGFYSNDSATVSYYVSEKQMKEIYRKPVVQVEIPKSGGFFTLTVNKTVSGVQTDAAFPFELTVLGDDGSQIDFSKTKLPDGVTLKDGTMNVLRFALADGEKVTLENIIPKGADLTLTETEHDGYTVVMQVGDLGSLGGETQSFDLNQELAVTVTNTAGAVLPDTGGAGELLFTLSGLLLLAAACVYGCIQRCSRERRAK